MNLLLFLGSFTLLTLGGLNTSGMPSQDLSLQHLAAKRGIYTEDSSKQLSEKNESESENDKDCQLPVLILPFIISCLQQEIYQSTIKPVHYAAKKITTPIYISVGNFRV